jgi:hypothetical protein
MTGFGNFLDGRQSFGDLRSKPLLVLFVSWLVQISYFDNNIVQLRGNLAIIRILIAQCRQLLAHLKQVERLGFLRTHLERLGSGTKPPRRIYWPDGFAMVGPDLGKCPAHHPSSWRAPRNRTRGLSLMRALRVNSGTEMTTLSRL